MKNRKWVKYLVSSAMVVLSCFSVGSGYYLITTSNQHKQQQEDLDKKTEENKQLAADKAALQKQINSLETEKFQLTEDKIVLEEEKAIVIEERDALASSQQTLQKKYEEVVVSEAALKLSKKDIEDQLAAAGANNQALQMQKEELIAKEAALKQEKESLTTQLAAVAEQKAQLQQKYEDLIRTEATVKAQYDATKAELDALKVEYEKLKQQGGENGDTTVVVPAAPTTPTDVSRLVLLIGDSMSQAHIDAAEERNESASLYMSDFAYSGKISLNDGENAENAYIGIAQTAKDKGLGLAFLTTDVLLQDSAYRFTAQGATEGDDESIIAAQLASEFDLILGADKLESDGTTYTYAAKSSDIAAAGFKFINNLDYKTVTAGQSGNVLNENKVFGAFKEIRTTEFTATQDHSKTNQSPCLGQMTEFAVNYMENKFPQGYVLIIENNQIGEFTDEFEVEGNSLPAAECVAELDRCIGVAREKIKEKDSDYAIVATGNAHSSNEVPYFVDAIGCDLDKTISASTLAAFMNDNLEEEKQEVKKIVYMVGDGFGVNHVAMAKNFLDEGESLIMESFEYSGKLDSNSITTFEGRTNTPDSAAGGSALATGVRVENGAISMDSEGNDIQTLSELFKSKGMGVGIISTDYLCETTPAAFSSHTANRYNFLEIRQDQYASGIDLFLGVDMYREDLLAPVDGFYPEYHKPNPVPEGYVDPELFSGKVYDLEREKIEEAGYTYITDMGAGKVDLNCEKLFGVFEGVSNTTFKAPLDSEEINTKPSLTQMTKLAMEWMERHFGDKGYFLMIEENNIDVESEQHSDGGKILSYETGDVVECILELDRATGYVKDFLDRTGDNYAIAVSADHASGSLTKSSSRPNYGFWSAWHDTQDIPYFLEVKAPQDIDFDWINPTRKTKTMDEGALVLHYCDCDVCAKIADNGGSTTGLTHHSRENITAFGNFEEIDRKFTALMSKYTTEEDFTILSNDSNFKTYLAAFDAFDKMFKSSANPVANNGTYDFTTGALLGVTKNYTMNFGTSADVSRASLEAMVAKLFGFEDVDTFKSTVTAAAATGTSLQNNGAAYTESVNKMLIMPYAIESNVADTIFAYILIDKDKNVSVWVSDVAAAYIATNAAGTATAENPATLTLSGRCTLVSPPPNVRLTQYIQKLAEGIATV